MHAHRRRPEQPSLLLEVYLVRRIRGAAFFMTVLVAAGLVLPAGAATKYQPCSLLTSAELEAVLGAKVERTNEQDITLTEGAYKGEILSACTWIVESARALGASLSVMRGPRNPEERAVAVAKLRSAFDRLKEKGWTFEPLSTPGVYCARAVPPASEASARALASCFMESKGLAFGLYIFKATVTADQVKSLGDRVVARLP